ncbi:hypothetical protein QA811_02105 [Streptomyces sp. B21-102]|uniref:hypothetical protein n=1 Tax=Streptomyces sp. B21-102 TaxID=3039416 RepID=UPI002FF3C52F
MTDSPLRQQIAATLTDAFETFDPERTEDAELAGHLADAVLAAILPHGKFLGDQLRESEGALLRVLAAVEKLAVEPHPSHDHLCPDDVLKAVRDALAAPADDAGPTVAEAAANDRRWPLEKAGE